MKKYDWIISGGRVIDPASDIDGVLDIAIDAGRIAAVQETLDADLAEHLYDARGKLVTPGLVDVHVHGYHLATPLGVDADHYCLGRGVTTAIDAGSAGCDTFAGFRAFAAEQSRTRLLGFLNISRAGLSFGGPAGGDVAGELETLKLVSRDDCVNCIESNRDLLVGVKVRLSNTIADEGRNEPEAYRKAREAALATELPLMVHHSFSTVPLEECPGSMAPGDIYTHAYHGYPSTIVDPVTRRVHPVVHAARENGVLFDIGHGMGAFNWTIGEICAAADFWPDIISTDMHSLTCDGPAYDMPTVMTRMLHLGMSLPAVIRCSTINAATAIGWEDRIGTLGVGREADVAVLALETLDMELEDCHAQMRRIGQRLTPQAVWRAGQPGQITAMHHWPNQEKIEAAKEWWHRLVIRDDAPP
ncbi:MAG: amidohydrolase/deacetylase family metallohydrolase [Lentisphaeria bacterium]|nr:amidohydrolase/deacetylase family metallohydrolase [Lentisphaeria bacterium]